MALAKLAFSNFVNRKARVALTVAAIALSVSLVVAVTSGYASAEAAARVFLAQFFGSTDFAVERANSVEGGVPESVVQHLRDDPAVRRVVGRIETRTRLIGRDGKVMVDHSTADLRGVNPLTDDAVARQKDKIESGGRWFTSNTAKEAVIDQGAQDRLKAKVGDEIQLPGPAGGRLALQIVGIVHKPQIIANGLATIYVPLKTLQTFTYPDHPDRVTKVEGEFRIDVDATAFEKRTAAYFAAADPDLKVKLTRETREAVDRNLRGIKLLSYMGGMVSMLAATFIVFSTLSMGVAERQRTLAMLRAVGARRGQVGRLVVIEGLALGVLGGIVGIALGFAWVYILAWTYPDFFKSGVVIDGWGVVFASAATLAAALAASLLPAWNAMRVDPLEAMVPQAASGPAGPPVGWTVAGLILVGIDPFLLFGPMASVSSWVGLGDFEREVRFIGHFVLGLPAAFLGFFLLAPLFVWLVERLASWPVAKLLGAQPDLLRQQLTGGGLWRAAGTAAALMVGLSVLVVMQTQGNSTMKAWDLPDKFPDVFIYTLNAGAGLDPAAQQAIRDDPDVIADKTMPIAIFNPRLPGNALGVVGAAWFEQTMFVAIDPDKAFDILELDFRHGSTRERAERELKLGRHIIITEEFQRAKGYKLGDTFPLVKGVLGGETIPYTICGIVWSPGIDVMVSTFDLGSQFEQQSAGTVFGSLADAKKDFGVTSARLMAADLKLGVDKKVVVERLKRKLGDYNLNVADVRQLKYNIQTGFGKLLMIASTVAWAAMAVASLGVANTVMAGIRSRRWQFGILRSVGVTRGGLMRLVLAEAALLGLVGAALGLSAGLVMAVGAHKLSDIAIGFLPPFSVPWGIVSVGVGVVMLVSLLASIGPALAVSRTEPLDLLQAGRAAA